MSPLLLGALLLLPAPALDEPGSGWHPADEPALSHLAAPAAAPAPSSRWRRGPRFQLSYRFFTVGDQGARTNWWHTFGVERYFISGILRGGGGLEAGFDASPRGDFTILSNLSLGVQYPARFTPFLEGIFGLGLVRRDALHRDLFCFSYQLGLDAGLALFVRRPFFLSLALGWRRPVVRLPGDSVKDPFYLYHDSFTMKVGLGL